MAGSRRFLRRERAKAWRAAVVALALAQLPGCASMDLGMGGRTGWEGGWAETWIGAWDDRWGEPVGQEPTLFGSYLAGRYAAATRDADDAAAYFRRALVLDPHDRVILSQAFLFDLARGDIDSALELAPRLLEEDPADPHARLVLALDALKARRIGVARSYLDYEDQDTFGRLTGALAGAWVEIADGDREAALARLSSLADIPAMRVFERYHAALIEDMSGNVEAAGEAFQEAFDLGGGRSLRLIEAYGSFLARAGRADEARALYESYLELAPSNPIVIAGLVALDEGRAPPPPVRSARDGAAEALYGVASVFPAAAKIEVPLAYLNLAVYLRPDFGLAHALIGDRLEAVHQWEEAADAYRAIDPKSVLGPTAALEIAYNYNRLDRTDEAIALLRQTVAQNPTFVEGLIATGDILRARERYEEAVEVYGAALERLNPADEAIWAIYYARGTALERLKRWPEAEESLLEALELRSDEPLILNYLGYSWVDQGIHLDRALKMIERAVELRPDDGFIVDSLGWAYYRLADYERAVRYLERAVELSPGDPTINDHLGDAYWRVGRTLEARFQWRHALAMEPEKEQIPKLEEKLAYGLSAPAGSGQTPGQ